MEESAVIAETSGRRQSFSLKDPDSDDYVLGEPLVTATNSGGGGGGGETSNRESSSVTNEEKTRLTPEEKTKLEQAGRRFSTRNLEKSGYTVEEMSVVNPGFDLRATKDSEELRVEVKAHIERATVVELTRREYQEYKDAGRRGYQWELWNVQHLAKQDEKPASITSYVSIPEEALNVRTFRVDLKKCQ